MRFVLNIIAPVLFSIVLPGTSLAEGWASLPDLRGIWIGKADFMLDDGVTRQLHRFEFTHQDGVFLKGHHSWSIPDENLKSHDGEQDAYEATEKLLGVIGNDGTIHVVEHGDTTHFEMRLLNPYTIDFIATEGGEHPLVGHGVLVRE